jgi:TonB-dependent receptor
MGVVMDVPFFANCVARISVAVRAALGSSGSVAVLSFALASSASAQTAGPEEVIVTGQRLGIETAQEIKRNAEQIVDSVAAVDISALPDRTVTEALQRVPGITIDRMFQPGDTNRFSAEGSSVLIRGLTQVRSELNGRDVFSARNTRALSFDDVPAELMAGVDVYKNPSADMIEGGLAGTVNLRTRRPFDADDRQFGVSGSLNYGDFVEETKPQASMLLSDRWQTGIGEIGVLAHVAYSELATRTDSIQYGRPFRRAASEVGNPTNVEQNCVDMTGGPAFPCVYIPQGTRWSELDFDRERLGYSAAIQWAPNDAVQVYAQALRSDYKMNWVEHSAWFQDWVYDLQPAPGTAFAFDSRGVFQSGTFVTTGGNAFDRGVGTGTTTRTAKTHQVTSDYSVGVKVDATERLALRADVQYVKATANNNDLTVNSQSRPPTLTLDMSGSLPQVSAPTDYFGQRGNYFWAAAMDDTQKNEGSEFAVRFDGEYSLETGWLNSIQAGVRYADRKATNRDTGYNWAPITETWNGASSLSMLDTVLTEQSTFFSFDNFYRGRTNLPSGIWVANESLARNLTGSSATIVQSAERGGFFVWAPDKFRESDINEQQEKSLAGFGMLRFGSDIGSMALDGNIGARVVRIEREAAGFVQLPLVGGNVDPEFVAQYGTGLWQPVSVEDEDTYVLPSLNLRLKLTPDLQARLAVSKAIANPAFDKQRATTTLGVDLNEPDRNQIVGFTGSGGNPLLKPMQAIQYDGSLEWYFAPAGSLTGTVFYKDVKDYFISGTSIQDYFGLQWEVESTVNGEQGVIKGLEVGYSQFFDRLPGFLRGLGAQANFTYVESAGSPGPTAGETTVPGLPLEGLSKTSYNLIAMYQRGRVEARLAYNWRERYLLTTVDGDDKGTVWNDDFGQLDGSVFVRFNDNLQVGLEANNLTNTTQKLLVGPYKYKNDGPDYNDGYVDHRLYQNGWFTYDRRVALTVRLTF